ncbi:hypothetical protein [Streptomyces werraensis]|uniref:hypothetical protein n=1 Tax=Streptomyces werraensis TaxID=68284 RepID=UPI0037D5C152
MVEAKGSTKAALGVRKGYSGRLLTQGTSEYFKTILNDMERRATRNERKGLLDSAAAEVRLMNDLRVALKQGKVDYILVKADFNDAQYAGYEMKQFDLPK